MAINTSNGDNPFPEKTSPEECTTRADQLEYLADFITQLHKVALRLDEKTLAYLLELAKVEAKLLHDAELYQLRIIEASEPSLPKR